MFIYFIYLLYIININIYFYNTYFDIFHWNYYPLYTIVFIYFIGNLVTINLNKDINIKNDYIGSFIVSFPGFIIFILSKYISSNNVYYIKYYWILLSGMFTYIFYSIIPFIIFIKNKYKNKKDNKNNEIVINKLSNNDLNIFIIKAEAELEFIKNYKKFKESPSIIYNNDIYNIYFKNIIEKLENYKEYKNNINDINDNKDIEKIEKLYDKIKKNTLIKIYEEIEGSDFPNLI